MIELPITSSALNYSWAKARDLGKLKNSITSGEGNQAGFLAEYLISDYLGGNLTNTYDYDITLPNGQTVDVKCKQTGFPPLPHYECSVAKQNLTQKCDYYVFARVMVEATKYTRCWFLGMIRKEDFLQKGRHLIKGQKDGDNGFIVRADCINIKISDLLQKKDIT